MMIREKREAGRGDESIRLVRAPALVCLSGWAVRFLLATVFSGVILPGRYSPFGVAFVGACGSGVQGAFALMGALFGALYFHGISAGLRDMAAAVLVYSVAFAFFDMRVYEKNWFMPAVTAGMVAVTGFVCLPVGRVGPMMAAGFFSAVFLSGMAVFFDRTALSIWPLTELGQLGRQQGIALLLFGGTILMALCRVTVLNGLSAGRILAAVAVLWAGALGGAGAGACVGLGAGVAMDLVGGQLLCGVAFGCSGLCSGLFRRQGRFLSTAVFLLIEGVMALWMWDWADGCDILLCEVFVAAVLFAVVPDRLFRRVQLLAGKAEQSHWDHRRCRVQQRLEQTAGAFRTVYETLKGSFPPGQEKGAEEPFRMFDRTAQRVCLRCVLREQCWQKEYQGTAGALNDALGAMLERGKGVAEDFPAWFSSRCIRFPAFLEAANEELNAFLYRRRYQVRLQESRAAVCRQYGELSRVLEGAALELSRELTEEPVRERRLGRWLAGQEIEGEWAVFYDEYGHLRAEILTREGEVLAEEKSRQAISRLFNLPLRPAEIKKERGKIRVIYTQAEPMAATAGVAAQKRQGEVVSGDSGAWFKGEDGVLWLLLCDGMGSGARAGWESELAIRLLKGFLRAGMPAEEALGILNGALALRSEAEGGFTTVDLCRVDLFTGAGAVYKFGGAPTYIKKGDTVVRISGTALPAGLAAGERVEADMTPFRLEVGDCLVMLTDGITDGEEDEWLRRYLREFDGSSPKDLARRLLEQGEQSAVAPDDRTVLVVQIGKRQERQGSAD